MTEARRVPFDSEERAEALRLATALAEAQDAYTEYLRAVLAKHGEDADAQNWRYLELIGVAVRIP